MKNKFTIISILFIALFATLGFLGTVAPAEACADCSFYDPYAGDSFYFPDYGGYDTGYYGGGYDWGYYDYYDPYYYVDFYYYQPPVYQPPVYNPPAVPTCTLSASQTNITAGTPVTISWTAGNASNGSISNIGTVSPSYGSRSVTPQVTTTYVGTFSGQGGTTSCQTTVVVQPQTPPTCTLTSVPGAINAGDSASLSWTSSNATSMTITNVGSVSTVGARTVNPGVTTTYIGTATGQGGSATCQTTVQVNQQPPQYQVPSCTLSITNTNSYSGAATLSWTTHNANTISISNVGTVNTGSGSRTVYPGNGNTTYVATVTGQGGTATCQASTYIQQDSAPWCTITASTNSVGQGNATVLQWNTSNNATSFFINNSIGYVNTGSGSRTVYPNTTLTYTGTVQNSQGQTANCQTTVGVFAASNATLYQQPGDQPLAFVSLSQVPYTGFEAGTLVTFIFWFAVALWSLAIAYVLMGKQGIQFIAERLFAFNAAVGGYQSHTQNNTFGTREDEYVNGFDHAETEPVVQSHMTIDAPVAAPVASVSSEATLRDVIEARAHQSGVLMSPEAVEAALDLGSDRDDTLQKFSEILATALETLPREDGWILLSSDRFDVLTEKYTSSTSAPEISSDDLNV